MKGVQLIRLKLNCHLLLMEALTNIINGYPPTKNVLIEISTLLYLNNIIPHMYLIKTARKIFTPLYRFSHLIEKKLIYVLPRLLTRTHLKKIPSKSIGNNPDLLKFM